MEHREWSKGDLTRVPYWVYEDDEIYKTEQERVYQGATWNFVGLEAEIPQPGDYKTTFVGEMPVIVCRDEGSAIRVFENRCAHRGSLLALKNKGHARKFTCVYHSWTHDLQGNLKTVAFRRGVNGGGGMPDSFDTANYGPKKLRVEVYCGLIFATLSDVTPPVEQYLGNEVATRLKRVLHKPLKIYGHYTQALPNNWKLYFENSKDTYHSSLLHTFFATFKVSRLSQGGGVIVAESGGHHVSYSLSHGGGQDEAFKGEALRSNQEESFLLNDKSVLNIVDEFGDGCHVQILSVFPGFVLQAIHNSLAVRQILPKAPDRTDLVWTLIGFADDDEDLQKLRMKHANLVGPAGYVSMEDGAVGGFVQRGIAGSNEAASVVMMGGESTESSSSRASENSIRGFWKAYRNYTGL